MYKLTSLNVLEEFASVASNLARGLEKLRDCEPIEIGNTPKQSVWKRDKVQLFRYTRQTPAGINTPVLLVYALVNRHDMMDLQEDRSFIRNLQANGADIYILDWGYPSPEDKYFTMDEYINGYISDAVDEIRKQSGYNKITIMGVCQGGTFSVIYTALQPEKIKNLVTLVTPVDFSPAGNMLSRWAKHLDVDLLVDTHGIIPGAFLNAGFEKLKPMLKTNKYISILGSLDKEEQVLNFLRMEKWIGDSPHQAGECFRQFVKELYQQNRLIQGTLVVGDRRVNLTDITMPLLNIYAEQDHLVPPQSSIPLNDFVGSTDKSLINFSGGHIGVFVGSNSQKELAPGIAAWLKERDN
jgi:polyhydroxyalkanoate synthase